MIGDSWRFIFPRLLHMCHYIGLLGRRQRRTGFQCDIPMRTDFFSLSASSEYTRVVKNRVCDSAKKKSRTGSNSHFCAFTPLATIQDRNRCANVWNHKKKAKRNEKEFGEEKKREEKWNGHWLSSFTLSVSLDGGEYDECLCEYL